jgi:hypothetical protein
MHRASWTYWHAQRANMVRQRELGRAGILNDSKRLVGKDASVLLQSQKSGYNGSNWVLGILGGNNLAYSVVVDGFANLVAGRIIWLEAFSGFHSVPQV